jgi:ribonuclease-3
MARKEKPGAAKPWDSIYISGVDFNDPSLLIRALTHRSYLNEHSDALEDNERLEFLGDAVLDFLVAEWLYHRYPEMAEGDLTRMRSALVHTEQLADFARQIDLGEVMRLGRGEVQGGGRDRDGLLCDTFEALVGAYFIDSGVDAVRKFIDPLLETTSEDILVNRKIEDAKSVLQEWAQAQGYETPYYQVIAESGPDHLKVFEVEVLIGMEVIGKGKGRSKQAASKSAASAALINMGLAQD